MISKQILPTLKKRKFLAILLVIFFFKQLLWIAIFPIFQGPDETVHYATIQNQAYPMSLDESRQFREYILKKDTNNISKHSEEITAVFELTEAGKISFNSDTTQIFTNNPDGQNENKIRNNDWKRIRGITVIEKLPGYYFIPSIIEKIFFKDNILTRFFIERIFSSILGLLIILFSYLTAKRVGFNEKISLLFSTIITFQPMFSQSSAIINYDVMLIFSFALFIYGAIWSLRDGLNWLNSLIMLLSAYLGIITKAPAIVLWLTLLSLTVYFARKKLKIRNGYFITGTILIIFFAILILEIISPANHLNLLIRNNDSHFDSFFQSLSKYISVTFDRWNWSEISYWGNFGWLDTEIPHWIVNVFQGIEVVSIFGIIAYFILPKKIPSFLPRKKFVVFLIGIFLALQFAIRFADWNHFDLTGKIEIGTYGRYFLPVIFAQFSLIIIGIGMLARKYSIWKNIIKALAISMILLWTYATLLVIIPRYYL